MGQLQTKKEKSYACVEDIMSIVKKNERRNGWVDSSEWVKMIETTMGGWGE